MSLIKKQLAGLIVLFAILDPFVTYHSFWQRVVVLVAITGVTSLFYVWGRDVK